MKSFLFTTIIQVVVFICGVQFGRTHWKPVTLEQHNVGIMEIITTCTLPPNIPTTTTEQVLGTKSEDQTITLPPDFDDSGINAWRKTFEDPEVEEEKDDSI